MTSTGWERVRLRIETKCKLPEPAPEISTHILDTSLGRAAANVAVTAYRLVGEIAPKDAAAPGDWQLCSSTITNTDGRISNVLGAGSDNVTGSTAGAGGGIYKLHFHVGPYFEEQQCAGYFYPFVEIVVRCEAGQHYHVPLLLNPYGYSTYRGT